MKSAHWTEKHLETKQWDRQLYMVNGSVYYRVTYSQGGIQIRWSAIQKHLQLHSTPLRGHGDNFIASLRSRGMCLETGHAFLSQDFWTLTGLVGAENTSVKFASLGTNSLEATWSQWLLNNIYELQSPWWQRSDLLHSLGRVSRRAGEMVRSQDGVWNINSHTITQRRCRVKVFHGLLLLPPMDRHLAVPSIGKASSRWIFLKFLTLPMSSPCLDHCYGLT